MSIAIANRKNRCDFGALRLTTYRCFLGTGLFRSIAWFPKLLPEPIGSTLLFQPRTVTPHKPTLRSNTLQGVDFGSILGQFLVSFGQND